MVIDVMLFSVLFSTTQRVLLCYLSHPSTQCLSLSLSHSLSDSICTANRTGLIKC